ncbi:hypothetical protein KIW84_061634 [Lathyrus oleraceus]|uniref:Uncharacterized protein n=1 Tax=Pisum sativum TaxID=3888 RepID=A0A9D4W5K0_PEA|nr:hypothetical protein KIW84_061634 [Pisum sativum]
MIGEQIENGLKAGRIQNATTSSLPVYPQEKYLLPNQKSTQGNQKQKKKEIVPKEIKHVRFPYHPKYNPNATYGYHARYVRHSTEACFIFKNKVQKFLDQKLLCSTEKPRQIILKNDHP